MKSRGVWLTPLPLAWRYFPTTPDMAATPPRDKLIGAVHLSFAALLFLTLAYFSIVLFTKTASGKNPTPQKRKRNTVYRISGYAILACILLIALVSLPSIQPLVARLAPKFWLEAVAIVAFGVSWLVKGETILKDQEA